jgi:hypothetical protein
MSSRITGKINQPNKKKQFEIKISALESEEPRQERERGSASSNVHSRRSMSDLREKLYRYGRVGSSGRIISSIVENLRGRGKFVTTARNVLESLCESNTRCECSTYSTATILALGLQVSNIVHSRRWESLRRWVRSDQSPYSDAATTAGVFGVQTVSFREHRDASELR